MNKKLYINYKIITSIINLNKKAYNNTAFLKVKLIKYGY